MSLRCPGARNSTSSTPPRLPAVVLRFGLLDGPGTGSYPPLSDFGATLHVHDAGRALLSALSLPSGICRGGERVSSERFTRAAGWHPAA
jgi:hypothetical protein